MWFFPQKANLHSARERQRLVSKHKRKCISGWVDLGKAKNFNHSQEDSHIFNTSLNMFHFAAKLSDREIVCEKAAC